jgi:group I intron endonuclease
MAEKNLSGVYRILHIASQKVYIGSSANIRARWATHRSSLAKGKHHSKHLQRAWDKYGAEAFEWSVIELAPPDRMLERETLHIALCGSTNPALGFNLAEVGGTCLGLKHTAEAKSRMSEGQKRIPYEVRLTYCKSFTGRTHSEETKALMSANSRRLSPTAEQRAAISKVHSGKTLSEAHKAAVSKATSLKNQTPEMRAKVSAALKGRVFSEEHRQALSAANKGRVISDAQKEAIRAKLKGRVFSPEHLKKIADSHAARRARLASQGKP